MSNFTAVYTHRVRSTGEIIKEMEYHGLCDVDGLHRFTDCAPHDLYSLSADKNDVGCIINAPADGDDFTPIKIQPGCHVIKRENGTIEVWGFGTQSIPYGDLEILNKNLIIT